MGFTTFLILLALVVAVSLIAQETGKSKELVAIFFGLALTPFSLTAIKGVHITPEFVIEWLLTVLITPAAVKIGFGELRRTFTYVSLLATVGVLTAAGVGTFALAHFLKLPLYVAALPAVALAATDPITVISLLKSARAPHRLALLFDLEALFNDATAAVAFRSALAFAAAGGAVAGSAATEALSGFVIATLGGIAAGVVIGLVGSWIHRMIDEPSIEVLLTVLIAFASMSVELLHVSGVLAVVVSAMVLGNVGKKHGMSAQVRLAVKHFWEAVEHGAVVLVFLLIGKDMNWQLVQDFWWAGLIAIPISLVMRSASVYLVTGLYNLFAREKVSRPFQHALVWGGVRGAVSLALVLGLPDTIPYAGMVKVAVYAVVLFNILIQGTTMGALLRRLDLVGDRRIDHAHQRLLLSYRLVSHQLKQLASLDLPGPIVGPKRSELEANKKEIESQLLGIWEAHPELLGQARNEINTKLAAASLDFLAEHGMINPAEDREAQELAEPFYQELHKDDQ